MAPNGDAGEKPQTAFDELCRNLKRRYKAIEQARKLADAQLASIRALLAKEKINLGDTLSLVVFGSLARREVTHGSDVDWTLLVDGPVDPEHIKVAARIGEILVAAGHAEPGNTGTFGTLASSHDIVHHIGGLEDTNRNMTRRLLLLLESRAVAGETVRSRVIRAVLGRYILWGRGLPTNSAPRLRVPRYLLNDVVRYWRTIAVDYAAKKWEQSDKKWAIRNAKLRVTRKMTFVKGLLLSFDCELFPNDTLWSSAGVLKSWDDADKWLASGCEKLVEETPIDVLSRALVRLQFKELANDLFQAYDDFLALIDDAKSRQALETLTFDNAESDPVFDKIRNDIGRRFRDALEKLFLGGQHKLVQLTKKYGLF